MIEITGFDMTRLQVRNAQMVKQLGLSEREVVATTTRQLTQEIVDGLPPRNRGKAGEKARKEVKKSFYAMPRAMKSIREDTISDYRGTEKEGDGGTAWLYASPSYLVGTPRENLIRQDLKSLMEQRFALQKRNAWSQRGKRGRQRVMIVNKPIISPTMALKLQKEIVGKYGKMKASFAKGFLQLALSFKSGTLKIQGWVKIHLASGKARGYGLNSLHEPSPSITLVSNATGIESDRAIKVIKRAIINRAAKMKKDLENQLSGVYKRAGYAAHQ